MEIPYIPFCDVCEHVHMCVIPLLWKYMGIHLVVIGNSGFPPLQWLGDWLPEAGRKMGVCGGKCNIGMETPQLSILLGNVVMLKTQ